MSALKLIDIEAEYESNSKLKREDMKALREYVTDAFQNFQISERELYLCLHSCYYDVDKAKRTVNYYLTFRTRWTNLFTRTNPILEPQNTQIKTSSVWTLSNSTSEGYKIIYLALVTADTSLFSMDEQVKLFFSLSDLYLAAYGNSEGFIFILDFNGYSWKHLAKFKIGTVKKFVQYVQMLKSCRKISMTVKSPALPSGSHEMKGTFYTRQTCSWMDRQGRPVSPPLEYSRPSGVPPQRYGQCRSSSKDRSIRRVDLCIEPGQSLGLMIRGGVEYNLGIFITGVDKDTVADRAGLMVGDQILEVNGQSFLEVTHDEAVAQLKYHKRMSLVVRDVGKVPHACTPNDRDWDLCSPGKAAQTTKKWSAALQMVEEKARCLLSKPEFTSLCYYVDEYASRHMTIDAFVQVMTEVLNTSEKYTLMTELREVVAMEDRSRFDELVYRRDHEAQRGRDPRDYDYRHSRRKTGKPDANNTTYVSTFHESEQVSKNEPTVGCYSDDEYRSPSEDSGLGMGISDRVQRISQRPASATNVWPPGKLTELKDEANQDYASADEENPTGTRSRRHSSPGESRSGSATALHQPEYSDSSGYLGGLRSSLGGWTQKVKSWYWGRPLELAHKLSRSFDMKDGQGLVDGEGGMRRHQSMQRLSRGDGTLGIGQDRDSNNVVIDEAGNLRVTVRKTKAILGIAIEGGANTKHPLPRIININESGAAYSAGGLEVGQLILQVDGTRVEGLQHQDVARLIADSFARRDREEIEFLVVEAKKSNMEPKPTALIFLEA